MVPCVPHPGVPLVEGLDVDEGHLPVGSSHDAIVLTADDEVDVVPELPPAVTARKKERLWSPEALGPDAPPTQGGGTREETYRYATEAISFLSMSSSTNGLGLGKLYLSFPCKNDTGVMRQRQPIAKAISHTRHLSFVTAPPGSLELEGALGTLPSPSKHPVGHNRGNSSSSPYAHVCETRASSLLYN